MLPENATISEKSVEEYLLTFKVLSHRKVNSAVPKNEVMNWK